MPVPTYLPKVGRLCLAMVTIYLQITHNYEALKMTGDSLLTGA